MKDSAEYIVECAPTHLRISFSTPRRILSSAVLNGGLILASHILNLKVDGNPTGAPLDPPSETLQRYALSLGMEGTVVGMMTAASMNSFRSVEKSHKGVRAVAFVTAGLSNARRAGERAECRSFDSAPEKAGTINIALVTNASLTPAAMVEAALTATEAKTAALQDMGVVSTAAGGPATGTGTDSIAIVGGDGPARVGYCGKHVIFGEMIALAVMDAVKDSLNGGKCCERQ